jgi:hypothetical protein
MDLDLVLYEKEKEGCPLAVAIEHENALGGIENEMDKLFLIRGRLKVLIIYAWRQQLIEVKEKLEHRIRKYYNEYHASNLPAEAPETEYLFLLGNEEKQKFIVWHYLSFDVRSGPGRGAFQISR